MKRIGWLGLGLVWVGGVVAGVACGSSDNAGVTGTPPATTPTTSATATSSAPGPGGTVDGDAGDDDGGEVTDGGENLDPDASDVPDATLPDGGACNTLDNAAPAVSSTCASSIPILGGGAIPAGTYYLTAVSDLGTVAFCKNTFVPVGFKETVKLTVDGTTDGGLLAETVTKLANNPNRPRTDTFVPASAVNRITVTGVCPVTPAANVEYGYGIRNTKPTLRMILPYGRGQAVYEFEKQ
jgi:hypothetical protein